MAADAAVFSVNTIIEDFLKDCTRFLEDYALKDTVVLDSSFFCTYTTFAVLAQCTLERMLPRVDTVFALNLLA